MLILVILASFKITVRLLIFSFSVGILAFLISMSPLGRILVDMCVLWFDQQTEVVFLLTQLQMFLL